MDVSQYLEIFVEETREHLQSLNDNILVLEHEPENKDTINEIFRSAHSLKGMAGTMGYKRMQTLTHDMENVFSEVRNDKMKVTSDLVDVLFQCLDALETYLDNIINTQDEGTDDNAAIIKMLNDFLNGGRVSAAPAASPAASAEAPSAPAGGGNFANVVFADFEQHAISEATAKNLNVYGIHVQVDPGCILKAARAFLVFKSVEEVGEIINSSPSAQDIEDERFDFEFDIFVISAEPLEKVTGVIKNVSEIKDAIGEKIVLSAPAEAEEKKATETVSETKPAIAQPNKPAAAQGQAPQKGKPVVNRSVRVDIDKLDSLMNLVSELIIAKNGLVSASTATDNKDNNRSMREQIEYLERVTTNLHESVMNVRMVPIETVVSRFPRMIRDLSKKLNKKMELYMTGEETELDRTVIDEIGDPLMHLLRNSADHGLETSEERIAKGKDETGTIFLNAYQDGNNVVIEVGDDGNGINVE